MKKQTTRDMIVTSLLVAMSIIIPMTFPQIPLPQPFSATLASHVPAMIAMFISPWSAIAVVIGSAIGFFMRLGLIVALRAMSHIIFISAGCFMIKKHFNLIFIFAVTMLLHGIAEAIIVFAFGNTLYFAAYTTGVGTLIHHAVDFVLTFIIIKALSPAKFIQFVPPIWSKHE